MSQRHKYSEEEIQFLRDNVKNMSLKQLTDSFNKHFGTDLTEQAISMQKVKYGLKSGKVGGRFQKGHVPSNKGKRMSKQQYIVCSKTMFKPGAKPKNTDPIGTEKMLSDGYVWVKVDDKPKVPKIVNWKQKHRIVWERTYGPIPEGYMIIFLDGNHENFDIDNLAMITKAENLIMNRKGLFKPDKDITKTGVQLAKLIDVTNKKVKKC